MRSKKLFYSIRNKKTKGDLFLIFYFLYYWLVSNLINLNAATTTELFIFVQLPVIILVATHITLFEIENKNPINVYFLFFLTAVILINLVKGDFRVIFSTAVDILPVYLILTNKKAIISLYFINYLFILQVILAIIFYYLEINPYGYFPGQSTVAEYNWKVSLFAYITPPFTSVFSFLVLLANAESQKKITLINVVVMILAVYFIIFSGSRTVYLISFFYLVYRIVRYFKTMQQAPRFYLYFPLIFIGGALVIGQSFKSFNNDLLDSMFLRNVGHANYYKTTEDLDRYILWKEYLTIFEDNWIAGAGSQTYTKALAFSEVGKDETLLPLMLAVHGVVYFIFLAGMVKLMRWAIKHGLAITYVVVIAFFVSCAFYGSLMRGYNLIWLFMFILIASEFNTRKIT
ncbi:MAG: O-antigen ligase family protein, partial [Mucilaginibacter sp.]